MEPFLIRFRGGKTHVKTQGREEAGRWKEFILKWLALLQKFLEPKKVVGTVQL